MSDREFDIVLFGATGFAGELTADYLARNAPASCRWALAGRNQAKLENVRARLATIEPNLATMTLLHADADDAPSLRVVAESARVVITTVGPYVLYGEPLVAACAEAGTDYVDLTGEPEFVDTMFLRHDARARETGARIVHSCGFDSIPHDLGAYFTVLQLPEGVPLKVSGYVRASGAPSAGTLRSAITAFSHGRQTLAAAKQRKAVEARPTDRSARAVSGRPHHDSVTAGWAVPLPTVDPQVVARSARAVPRYGPDFQYSHYASIERLAIAVGGVAGAAALFAAVQVPPLRKALLSRIKPGDGPSASKRARSWFAVTFVGTGGGRRVVTRVSGGDPGYDETAKMLAESALCLAFDDLPRRSGQVTPVTAMGDALLERLQKAGMGFEIIEA
jgi:short subunit dehydrogenase-like uncharacterized protein